MQAQPRPQGERRLAWRPGRRNGQHLLPHGRPAACRPLLRGRDHSGKPCGSRQSAGRWRACLPTAPLAAENVQALLRIKRAMVNNLVLLLPSNPAKIPMLSLHWQHWARALVRKYHCEKILREGTAGASKNERSVLPAQRFRGCGLRAVEGGVVASDLGVQRTKRVLGLWASLSTTARAGARRVG